MVEDRYLFIDGAHLRKNFTELTGEWANGDVPNVAIQAVKSEFDARKCFYYDAVDDQPRKSEDEESCRRRLLAEEVFHEGIQRIPGTHVRLGSVTGSLKNRRQKQVDILLAVEMMNHAVRGNMRRAVLLSGDQDFKPLVDSLVQMGLYVEVAGDRRYTSRDLSAAADEFTPLSFRNYHAWAGGAWRSKYPVPEFGRGNMTMSRYKQLRTGSIGSIPVDLSESPGEGFLLYFRDPAYFQYARGTDAVQLERACSLEFGPITWAD